MKDLIKNNWINGLGIGFIFTAFLYFLKMAADQGWLPPDARAALGLILGVSSIFIGYVLSKKEKIILAEAISGVGFATIYATIAYISFSTNILWSPNALLISMVALSIATSFLAYKSNRRILYLLSTIGALITPLVLKVSESQDSMLFIYLLTINIGVLYIGSVKKWQELKLISFALSLAIFSTYYVLFDPVNWGKPFFYICSFFLVYLVGFSLDSWKSNQNEFGVNQYLGIINAINFVFWSNYIFGEFEIPHTLPMAILGLIFIGVGSFLFILKEKELNLINGIYLGLGIVSIAIACSDTGLLLLNGMNYVVNGAIWIFR